MTNEKIADADADLAGMNHASVDGASVRGASVRKANVRMGLILASIAVVFFVGFVVKMVLLSRPA